MTVKVTIDLARPNMGVITPKDTLLKHKLSSLPKFDLNRESIVVLLTC